MLPMRALADDEGVPRWVATLAVALSAPLAAAAVFDFHPSTLATPFVGWCLLGARRGDLKLTTWAALAVVACRADLGCVLFGIAIAFGVANAAIAILGISLVYAFADRRLEEQNLRLTTALDNMSQGLVMFDASSRLVICNRPYLQMYSLGEQAPPP